VEFVEKMKAKWGVGPWGVAMILLTFTLTGLTVVRLKGPILGLILPEDAPGWQKWGLYLLIIFPLYQVILLAYGTLLGQFNFFWSKFKFVGRKLTGRG